MYDRYVPGTVEKLEQEIQAVQDKHETMKRINAYHRKHKTLDGCLELNRISQVSSDKILKRLQDKPSSDQTIRLSLKHIKELKNRLLRHQALRDAGDGWEFNGGRIEIEREKGWIMLYDSSDKVHQRIRELGVIFYATAPDGTPRMMFYEHVLVKLLEMTKRYDELYPASPITKEPS